MGILAENLEWMYTMASTPTTMLELGDQFLYISAKPWANFPDKYVDPSGTKKIVAKPYFNELGYDHVSIDLNGEDGSLSMDLSKPLSLGKKFKVITDFGTSEHVSSLYDCLLNMHNHCEADGKIFQVNPLTGNWIGHGFWYRDEEFYTAYAKMTGYTILNMKRFPACGNYVDGWNIWCALQNNSNVVFPTKAQFDTLPIKTK